ncbi:MAG TPA: tetratricopeptide repeat protein [bacterium]
MGPDRQRFLSRRVLYLMALVFVAAFAVRLVYLTEISRAPYFDDPAGDSRVLLDQALDILKGHLLGEGVYFYSSPPYPYFIAAVLALAGRSFFILGLIQIVIGSLNCLLIFMLAWKVTDGRTGYALIAGILSVLYGLLVFFDADMLMIFVTLVFVDLCLLFLTAYDRSSRGWHALAAGACLGAAALDRTNILLFLPVALWFVAGRFSTKLSAWKWKPAILLLAGAIGLILPFTVRNALKGHDFMLVSSNAGVNLFIGNNPQAVGAFYLPPGSGLSNYDLGGSASAAAEAQTGRALKPSGVSSFWASKAFSFILHHPGRALGLLWRKITLFWNSYEIPNNLDFYFIRAHYAPVLKITLIGFWLIGPLALTGILMRIVRGLKTAEKLLLAFLITYMLSVVVFFVTERYRVPVVPVLIVFTVLGARDFLELVRARSYRTLGLAIVVLAACFALVNWPRIQFDYERMRSIIGSRYLTRALEDPGSREQDLKAAIVELKWALELDPADPYARYELARAYASLGYFSGAIQQLEFVLKIDPQRKPAAEALEAMRLKFRTTGDLVGPGSIPLTPYEKGFELENKHLYVPAQIAYREAINDEPCHVQAYNNLGRLLFQLGRSDQALSVLSAGLRKIPNSVVLLYDLGIVYFKTGQRGRARQSWQRCLEIEPDNTYAKEAIRMLGESH